jgi:hypothetical protein
MNKLFAKSLYKPAILMAVLFASVDSAWWVNKPKAPKSLLK